MANTVLMNVFFMLGGVALLMFGMRFMGANLEQVAGNNMKKMLGKMTNNRFAGVGVGAAVTAIINSSAATTVMLVGFVNVGLMTLAQAASVIMGANIGTTITAQILSLSGADGIEVAAIASVISAVGAALALFFKKDKVKKIGSILLGFGMIFLGLKIMSVSVNSIIYEGGALKPIFKTVFQGDHFPLLLVLIGVLFTAVIQSSAAVTGILIALGGALNFNTAVFIILGSNIGTCVTALISSIGTSTNAKRTAVIHLLFNLFGCLICIAPLWIFSESFSDFMTFISGESTERKIANFHTLFNIGTTVLLIPFTDLLVSIAKRIVPDKKNAEDKHRLTFIDERLLSTPPIAVANTKKEIIKMAGIAKENINLAVNMLLSSNLESAELLKDNEDALNFLNKNITAFLTKVMSKEVTRADEKALGSYYHVVVDIERVGDYAVNVMEYTERLKNLDASLSEDAIKELTEVLTTINSLFDCSLKVFENLDSALLTEVDVLENSIDEASVELEARHIERIKKGVCDPETGSIFLQTVSNLERVGDHITNIAFSIKNYRHR